MISVRRGLYGANFKFDEMLPVSSKRTKSKCKMLDHRWKYSLRAIRSSGGSAPLGSEDLGTDKYTVEFSKESGSNL